MQSNLEVAKTPFDNLMARAETQHFLSQIRACDTSVNIELDEVGRDGLANLFYMLARECERTLEKLEQERKERKWASHE